MHIKSLATGGICLITGISFWFFFKDAIVFGDSEAFPVWLALAFLTLFLVSFSLVLLFTEHRMFVGGLFFFSMTPLLYFFGFTVPVLVCFVLAISIVLRAHIRICKEAKSRINVRIPVLLREGLPLVLTALTLLFAVAYYTETNRAPQRFTIRDILPRAVFERMFLYTPVLGKNILPDFDPRMTVDEYAARVLKQSGVDITQLSPAEQRRVLEEARKQLFRKDTIDGSMRLSGLLYDIVAQRSEEFIAPYERFVPIGFTVAFFLFLRSVAFPFGWIVIWICVGVVKFLVAKKIISRTQEQTLKERLAWT